MTNQEVCLKFVAQSNTHGRSSNLRYEGNVLYSYRTEIARIIDGELFYSFDRMSSSTGRHIGHLLHAAILAKLPMHRVYYRFNDGFLSDVEMLRGTYIRLVDALVGALSANNSPGYSRPLTQCRKRRELLQYASMLEDLNKVMKLYFPDRIDATFLVRLARKVLKETKANRRRWRTWNTFVPSEYHALLGELSTPRAESWRTEKEVEVQRLHAEYLETLRDLGVYELSKELGTTLAGNKCGWTESEYDAWLAAICTSFRRKLDALGLHALQPFYVTDTQWLHFVGRTTVPAALFRQMEYQRAREYAGDMRSSRIVVTADVHGNHLELVMDHRYASLYQLDGIPVAPTVYETILKLIKEAEDDNLS